MGKSYLESVYVLSAMQTIENNHHDHHHHHRHRRNQCAAWWLWRWWWLLSIVMVAARTHAPGKRGPSFRKSYAGGNSARVVYSQGANQGLQGFAPRQVCTLGAKGAPW